MRLREYSGARRYGATVRALAPSTNACRPAPQLSTRIIRRVSEASQLSPELAQKLLLLARALLGAVRNWTLYPPEHPSGGHGGRTPRGRHPARLEGSRVRIRRYARDAEGRRRRSEGRRDRHRRSRGDAPRSRSNPHPVRRGGAAGRAPPPAARPFTLDAAERRQRGGPAKIWAAEGDPSIVLDQFDYEQLLAREHTGERAAAGRDGLWRSIVLSIDHRIETLVAQCDPRVVPMLVRIIEESEPLGKDHEVVLETIEALGLVPSDVGVTALARVITRRGFFGAPEAADPQGTRRGCPGPDRDPRSADCPGRCGENRGPAAEKNCRRPSIGGADK